MHLRALPVDEAAVRRYIEELWLPYNRDLADAVDGHALVDDEEVDIVAEELEFRLDRLAEDGYEVWVAVDGPVDESGAADPGSSYEGVADVHGGVVDAEGDLAGFITTNVDESPSVFAWPDRLVVGDLYVGEPYRGGDLARTLMVAAAERARTEGCDRVVLDVDAGNERARSFYDTLGFEPVRHRMAIDTDDL